MIRRLITAATLALSACTAPTPALGQSLTLTNLKAPIAKASGKPAAKSVAELWAQINALPVPAPVLVPNADSPAPTTPAGTFDAAYYLRTNPDVAAAGITPAEHYNRYGKWEGRLPYAGAARWKATDPLEYEGAPACAIEVQPTWAPAGTRQVRVHFKLTRYGDGTKCERSYSIGGYSVNPTDGQQSGFSPMNVSGEGNNTVTETLSLPSQGSEGDVLAGVPSYADGGYFDLYLSSAEYNEKARSPRVRVYVGNQQPAGTVYNATAAVLPSPTPYPTSLGTPTYQTDFLGPLGADGWTFSPGVSLNNSLGYFSPETGWKTASGVPIDNYPVLPSLADGRPVRTITVHDHRQDLAQGKYLFTTGIISRLFGDGRFGFRRSVMGRYRVKGGDPAYWGISVDNGWPPEMDTDEGFTPAGPVRIWQTWHPRSGGATIGFTPAADADGKHEWMEEFNPTTYRLWLDRRLVVERPNYQHLEAMMTTHGFEVPGGAGGAFDGTQVYEGARIELYGDGWWQR